MIETIISKPKMKSGFVSFSTVAMDGADFVSRKNQLKVDKKDLNETVEFRKKSVNML